MHYWVLVNFSKKAALKIDHDNCVEKDTRLAFNDCKKRICKEKGKRNVLYWFQTNMYTNEALAKDVKSSNGIVHSRKYLTPRSKADTEIPTLSQKVSSCDKILPLLYPYDAGVQAHSLEDGSTWTG